MQPWKGPRGPALGLVYSGQGDTGAFASVTTEHGVQLLPYLGAGARNRAPQFLSFHLLWTELSPQNSYAVACRVSIWRWAFGKVIKVD